MSKKEKRHGEHGGQPQPQQWPGKQSQPGQQWPGKQGGQPEQRPNTWPTTQPGQGR